MIETRADDVELPASTDSIHRVVAVGAVTASVVGVLVLAGLQVHPDSTEFLLASLMLLAGLFSAFIALRGDDLRRVSVVAVPALVLLALLGWLQPTNLVAVDLVLGHPALFLFMAALAAERAFFPLANPRLSEACRLVLVPIFLAALGWGGIAVLTDTHRTFQGSTEASEGPARIDSAVGGWDGGCTDSHSYLRTGSGFALREQYLGDACQGSPVFDTYRVDGDPGVTRSRGNASTCAPGDGGEQVVFEFDPQTLSGAEKALTLCD